MPVDNAPHAADFRDDLRQTLAQLRRQLLDDRGEESHWTGQLSASALSSATAISALSVACERMPPGERRERYLDLIRRGVKWIDTQQNADGGFGDTDLSHSNIATSYLVLAAKTLAKRVDAASSSPDAADRTPSNTASRSDGAGHGDDAGPSDGANEDGTERLRRYLDEAGGIPTLRRRYGKDKTFVVPILNNLAIAGCVPWSEVAALPFEAAVFPQSMYRFLGMPVVSYAVPALVAIGQAKFLRSGCLPPWSWVRKSAINPTLNVLRRMQPDSGGYLEATPLTAFVVMSLVDASSSSAASPSPAADARAQVIELGLKFLEQSITPEGSWPIDTNLATWVTSLSVAALACDPADGREWCNEQLVDWILSCQHTRRHSFTGADPGGWGWTDLSGAVPDADDTPGALLALAKLRDHLKEKHVEKIDTASAAGKSWLLGLQNRDGGWPTFCRGWGKLPFDRSSTDLTAHAIRALAELPSCPKSEGAIEGGLKFLRKSQRSDGSWVPLWFGNQDRVEEDNPIYGTAKVLVDIHPQFEKSAVLRGIEYLVNAQNEDGGWGGGDSVSRYWTSVNSQNRSNGSERVDAERGSNEQSPAIGRETTVPEIAGGNTATLPHAEVRSEEGEVGALGISSVEETALAVEALASLWHRLNTNELTENCEIASDAPSLTRRTRVAILAGSQWLIRAARVGRLEVAWPIGFYFAKLWYHERLYPLIFTTAALGRVAGLDDTISRPETTLPR
ncbi:prenyltransferase/squalene oxidase repeat-containing protein [Aporhodopirellula aestuarii]|uniref:Squalene--hopene cyclase n=1 Tax=Aporhodopirellula aestuarii TaxID=2950107 RepID=A0ABT0TWW1_9BACT|nr:prenyltransferase/squalene oxidase repeat-containing protein [Aporhodopirellula aestuarii]MCM2369040.1 squalene--hopene cyclase [Aporhodopirellula aestuarii]